MHEYHSAQSFPADNSYVKLKFKGGPLAVHDYPIFVKDPRRAQQKVPVSPSLVESIYAIIQSRLPVKTKLEKKGKMPEWNLGVIVRGGRGSHMVFSDAPRGKEIIDALVKVGYELLEEK
jgi:hypothetical protein